MGVQSPWHGRDDKPRAHVRGHARTHAHRDVPIGQVMDEGIAEQLFSDMKLHGVEHVDQVELLWAKDFRQRTIIGRPGQAQALKARACTRRAMLPFTVMPDTWVRLCAGGYPRWFDRRDSACSWRVPAIYRDSFSR